MNTMWGKLKTDFGACGYIAIRKLTSGSEYMDVETFDISLPRAKAKAEQAHWGDAPVLRFVKVRLYMEENG